MRLKSSGIRWFVFLGIALISMGLGFTGAKILANETIGYLAGYTWFALMLVGLPLVLGLLTIGAFLIFSERTRWTGFLAISAAFLIATSAFASFKTLDALGMVHYKHEQMVPIIPEVAQLVIFLKTSATHDEIQSFWNETLSTKQGTGSWPRAGIRDILRHGTVSDHEVIVVGFFPSAYEAERNNIRSIVASSPLVFKFFENVPYAEIDRLLESKQPPKATSNKSLDASGGRVNSRMKD